MNPHTMISALPALLLFEFSRTAFSMSIAGIVLFVIGLWAAKTSFAQAQGLDKIVALTNLCFAAPLAVFGAEHFSAAQGISQIVPKYMHWPMFWTYFVGLALVGASLSIATKIQVVWSGLLFGCMMFCFAAMMTLPAIFTDPHNRIIWVLLLREPVFGSGAWILAACAMANKNGVSRILITFGRIVMGISATFYGVQNFLHPLNVPGVPLEKMLPAWIPVPTLIGYLTAAILVVAGLCILLGIKTRMAATYLGSWLFLLVIFIYGPILVAALLDPSTDVKVEGLNYFFDTLLYDGAILALASAVPRSNLNLSS
jgi:uncharacterized membrane protein YphA (DoxX/SURF4 family)